MRTKQKDYQNMEYVLTHKRTCKMCGIVMPIVDFPSYMSRKKLYYSTMCTECRSLQNVVYTRRSERRKKKLYYKLKKWVKKHWGNK